MARWMDDKFQKIHIGTAKVSDTLIDLGKKYLAIKKLTDLPAFTKEAFNFFKTAKETERKILGFFEPQFFVIESFEDEKVKNWFEKYANRCNGKDAEEMDFVPKAFRKIKNSFVSIDNFDNKEIFDDEVDEISEKEFKKQKKNGTVEDEEEETSEITSASETETSSTTDSGAAPSTDGKDASAEDDNKATA